MKKKNVKPVSSDFYKSLGIVFIVIIVFCGIYYTWNSTLHETYSATFPITNDILSVSEGLYTLSSIGFFLSMNSTNQLIASSSTSTFWVLSKVQNSRYYTIGTLTGNWIIAGGSPSPTGVGMFKNCQGNAIQMFSGNPNGNNGQCVWDIVPVGKNQVTIQSLFTGSPLGPPALSSYLSLTNNIPSLSPSKYTWTIMSVNSQVPGMMGTPVPMNTTSTQVPGMMNTTGTQVPGMMNTTGTPVPGMMNTTGTPVPGMMNTTSTQVPGMMGTPVPMNTTSTQVPGMILV